MILQFDNAQKVTIIITLIGIISPLLTIAANSLEKFLTKRNENHKYKYDQYHTLIQQFTSNAKMFAECQIAEVYELRKYRNNRHATKHVLQSIYNANKETFDKQDNILGQVIRKIINNLSISFPIIWRYIDKESRRNNKNS